MATKKTTKKVAPARPAAKAVPAKVAEAHAHVGDCCSADSCGSCCASWGIATRFWWSVTWRTFLWVSLPVTLLQLALASLANPGMPYGILNFFLMMLMNAPRMLAGAIQTVEFWFFLAVTLYTVVGAIFVYGHLIRKGKFLGLNVCVERDVK